MKATGTVLILTSSMGAGHDAVSHELCRRLEARGYEVRVMDMVQIMPFRFGWVMRGFYSLMIRWAPWLYSFIYRVWLRPSESRRGPISPVTRLLQRRIRRWVSRRNPVAIVSTFHMCTQTLGNMRRHGELTMPIVNVIVDFAVHGLWVHPDVDLNLCLHGSSAATVRRRTARRVVACGPIVRPEYLDPPWDRRSMRTEIGAGPDDAIVLIVGGSWGSGEIAKTVEAVNALGRYFPIVVCGHNEKLYRRARRAIERLGNGAVYGWVEDLSRLMVASDVLLENAGGMTSFEAAAAGLPVVSYRPIPGHGIANVMAMEEAGVIEYARNSTELRRALESATQPTSERLKLIGAAAELFDGDAAAEIDALIAGPTP